MEKIEEKICFTEIITDPIQILEHIQIGISIPVLPEFHKYIKKDLQEYDAKAIFLKEKGYEDTFGKMTDNVIGFCLVYNDGSDILFFGFFRVYDHSNENVEILLNTLITYAKEKGFKRIRGPINVPASIFGWGFMQEGSRKDLFIGSPINPPIYQKKFKEKGFIVLFQEDRYDMPALRMDPHKDNKLISMGINKGYYENNPFDTGDYEYEFINPTQEELRKIKEEFISLNARFMPPSAQISPTKSHVYDGIVDFIHEFGARWMIWIVREKATGKMVANGYVIPDPFHRNKKGELNSISFHAWVVDSDHRRKYLAMLMYGFTSIQAKNRKTPHFITRGSWPVGAENIANASAAQKMGGKKDRSHLILELEL